MKVKIQIDHSDQVASRNGYKNDTILKGLCSYKNSWPGYFYMKAYTQFELDMCLQLPLTRAQIEENELYKEIPRYMMSYAYQECRSSTSSHRFVRRVK